MWHHTHLFVGVKVGVDKEGLASGIPIEQKCGNVNVNVFKECHAEGGPA